MPPPLDRAEAVQGWMRPRELAFLYGVAHSVPPGGRVAEVGSWKGRSTVAILEGLRGSGGRLTAVDTFEGEPGNDDQMAKFGGEIERDQVYAEFCRNTADYDFDVVRATSIEAAQRLADESLDWVFIDAEHTIERLTEDIEAWWPKLKPGGLLSGHDYLHLEVRIPVSMFFGRVSHWETIWFTRKDGPLKQRPIPAMVGRTRVRLRQSPALERQLERAWSSLRSATGR